MVGIARPSAVDPDYPNKVLRGQAKSNPIHAITTGIKMVDEAALMEVAWYSRQLHRMGDGKNPRPNEGARISLIKILLTSGINTFRSRRVRA